MVDENLSNVPDITKRALLQYLSLTNWKMVAHLPVPASEVTLSRLIHQGLIEIRGEDKRPEVRLTEAGLKEAVAYIKGIHRVVELGSKTKAQRLIYERRTSSMKGSKIKEHVCPVCNGTGYPAVKQPVQQGRKIYPVKCKSCEGKGKVSDSPSEVGKKSTPRLPV